jgi:hypothetical protein
MIGLWLEERSGKVFWISLGVYLLTAIGGL